MDSNKEKKTKGRKMKKLKKKTSFKALAFTQIMANRLQRSHEGHTIEKKGKESDAHARPICG